MKNIPRLLPLVGIAAAGVLAVNALAGARSLPDLVSGAKAMAEEAAKPAKAAKAKAGKADKPVAGSEGAPAGADPAAATSALALGLDASGQATARPAPPVCAPTAAELAKEAGLSPAELQILQSLGARRGQLDQRENDLNTQLALMAAAEAKLDAKVKALNGLKADITNLMGQADAKQQAEVDRMVKVFEGMKPKDSAMRMVVLDDTVRLPIAAKMKERSLSAMLAQMPPMEAKKLTEALSKRFSNVRAVAAGAEQTATQASANVPDKGAGLAGGGDTTKADAKADAKAEAKAAPAKAAAKPKKVAAKKKPAAVKLAGKGDDKPAADKPATDKPVADKTAAADKPAAPAKTVAASPATPAPAKPAG